MPLASPLAPTLPRTPPSGLSQIGPGQQPMLPEHRLSGNTLSTTNFDRLPDEGLKEALLGHEIQQLKQQVRWAQ